MKRVAIHQPNYFPWMGYFLKMASVDTFIYHDAVTLNTRGYTRRCYLRPRVNQDNQRLSVTLSHPSQSQLIQEVKLSDDRQWQAHHWNIISLTYRESLHYDTVSPWIKDLIYNDSETLLADHNRLAIGSIAEYLGIDVECVNSSEYTLTQDETNAKHISLITQVNGTHYVSGTGGRAYQQDDIFAESGINLTYLDSYDLLSTEVGTQRAQLSILDYLFDYSQMELHNIINKLVG